MEGVDRKMMWAQRQRWAAQLLKEVERKGTFGLLQLRLFLAGEVGQHGWAVDAVCGEGEDAEQFVCMMAELACRETTPAVRTAGLRQRLPIASISLVDTAYIGKDGVVSEKLLRHSHKIHQ